MQRERDDVNVEVDDKRVYTRTPYHPDFVDFARNLNGTWDRSDRRWAFSRRDEERVRNACVEVYGTDGDDWGSLVDARVEAAEITRGNQRLFMFGRPIVQRLYRDDPVILDDHTVVLEGSFPSSGGSRKNPRIHGGSGYGGSTERVVLEVRDLPVSVVEKAIDEWGDDTVWVEDGVDDKKQAETELRRALAKSRDVGFSWSKIREVAEDVFGNTGE